MQVQQIDAPTISKTEAPKIKPIRVVAHGTANGISIDEGPLMCKGMGKCKFMEHDFYINRYRAWFWEVVNNPGHHKHYRVKKTLTMLFETWMEHGKLLLAHDRPLERSHAEVIIEYLNWERDSKTFNTIKGQKP